MFYDEKNEYTIPYAAGIQTIVYNSDKVKMKIKGYKDLWDGKFKDSLGIVANFRVIDGMALTTFNWECFSCCLREFFQVYLP